MAYDVKVIADSITYGNRLTTLEVTLPRIVLAEFNTHRMFSRNSASSRAIPVEKMLKRVEDDPFIPIYWGKNQKGMQADEELSLISQRDAELEWLLARDHAVTRAKQLLALGIHKQITNRLLEPWLWQTIIVSATEVDNFLALRTHKDAQPEIQRAAVLMDAAYKGSEPKILKVGEWHLPLLPDISQLLEEGYTTNELCLISVGRCARVSYLTHNGTREPKLDIELALKLQAAGHMSPFEHVAQAMSTRHFESNPWSGNFFGWIQFRKTLHNEDNFMKTLSSRGGK